MLQGETFRVKESALALDPPAIAGDVAIATDHTMAGYGHRDAVAGTGARNGPCRSGAADPLCKPGIADGLAHRNPHQGLPDPFLEGLSLIHI